MSDKMREAFEKWAVYENLQITRGRYYDVYASAETRVAYLAWQAAHAAALPPGFVAVPMTKDRIKEEWDAFIAYPEGSGKLYVTTTSALLFAYLISSMTADAMLAARPEVKI